VKRHAVSSPAISSSTAARDSDAQKGAVDGGSDAVEHDHHRPRSHVVADSARRRLHGSSRLATVRSEFAPAVGLSGVDDGCERPREACVLYHVVQRSRAGTRRGSRPVTASGRVPDRRARPPSPSYTAAANAPAGRGNADRGYPRPRRRAPRSHRNETVRHDERQPRGRHNGVPFAAGIGPQRSCPAHVSPSTIGDCLHIVVSETSSILVEGLGNACSDVRSRSNRDDLRPGTSSGRARRRVLCRPGRAAEYGEEVRMDLIDARRKAARPAAPRVVQNVVARIFGPGGRVRSDRGLSVAHHRLAEAAALLVSSTWRGHRAGVRQRMEGGPLPQSHRFLPIKSCSGSRLLAAASGTTVCCMAPCSDPSSSGQGRRIAESAGAGCADGLPSGRSRRSVREGYARVAVVALRLRRRQCSPRRFGVGEWRT